MISLIAAVARDGVIGLKGGMPWDLPADMKYFMETTMGHVVIMGRKTFESLDGPLDGRTNVVLTSDEGFWCDQCILVHSLEDAVEIAELMDDEVFIAGGGAVYEQFMERADRMYITEVDAEFDGDTRYPLIDDEIWSLESETEGTVDDENIHPHRFMVYSRKG